MKGVIEDSDDESDGGGYVDGGGGDDVQAMIKAQLSGSGEVGHATSSTDPAFFHSVLMEQSNAAGHQTRAVQGDIDLSEWNQHEHDSLPPTATPFAGQEGVQQPLPTMDSSFYPPTAPTKLAMLPPTESQVDPYDIRSSPEQQVKAKSQRARKKTERNERSSEILDAGDQESVLPARSAKRRRTEESYAEQETVECINIPSSSPQRDAGVDENNEICINAPMETEHSVTIAANHLTTSQKLEYRSVELPSSPTQQSTSAPQPITRNCPIESSLGTNINTQRSVAVVQREPSPTQPAPVEEIEAIKRKPGRPKKDTSSTATCGETSTKKKKVARSSERILEDSGGEEDDWLGPDYNADDGEANVASPVSLPDDSPVKAKPKAKGKRGRPKKTQEPKVVEDVFEEGDENVNDKKTPAKVKKGKRGRPKKTKEPAAVIPVIEIEGENAVSADGSVAYAVKDEENDESKEVRDTSQVKVDDEEVEEEKKASISEPPPEEPAAKKESVPEERKPLAATNSNGKKASKLSSVGGTGTGKPLYRVGLSRRTSIAPLLKVIRK